mmetsp:Transcript_3273/g.9489  ORF Transcript_3273/g.9489 Transcript_3273/m.9489 type:complete len:273 (+) Transcript_3273:3-821(+)
MTPMRSVAPLLLSLLAVTRALKLAPLGLTRRNCLASAAAALSASVLRGPALAAGEEDDVEVYFGCGCFWHVQHELVEAERRILGRKDSELTALAGYAGGLAGTKDGKVCYHNALQISEYGRLGHAEVVRLKIPPATFGDFATEYFKLFDDKGFRPDQWGDRGLEYRNLVGIPGGGSSPLAKTLIESSKSAGDKLDIAKGTGDDADKPAVTWVMDTAQFPFYVAEGYHQFHDGFAAGEDYPSAYNSLASKVKSAKLMKSTCPNGMLGVGVLGL